MYKKTNSKNIVNKTLKNIFEILSQKTILDKLFS